MVDIPSDVAIVSIICVTVIVATMVVCDCVKQKPTTADNVSTTNAGVSTTEQTTESSTVNLRNDKNER